MKEEQIQLVNEHISKFAFLPVTRNTVQDRIEDNKHAYGFELFSELQNVVADQTVRCIDIGLLSKCVERSLCEEFQFKGQLVSLLLRLPEQLIPEINKSRSVSLESSTETG